MTELFPLCTLADIQHNMRVKIFPSGRVEALVSDAEVFRESGWEPADFGGGEERSEALSPTSPEDSLSRSKRRARSAMHDLAHANTDLDIFVTFTLDAAKVDRYDVATMTKRLNTWLDNRVRRDGLKYILVPELHKDGAVHYHGLLNSAAVKLTDSGTVTKGGAKPRRCRSAKERAALLADGWQIVYNLPSWGYGFSTGIFLYGCRAAAVNYTTKYIEKSAAKVGGRWYYSGGALARPAVYCLDCDYDAFKAEHAEAGEWSHDNGWRFCAAVIEEGEA